MSYNCGCCNQNFENDELFRCNGDHYSVCNECIQTYINDEHMKLYEDEYNEDCYYVDTWDCPVCYRNSDDLLRLFKDTEDIYVMRSVTRYTNNGEWLSKKLNNFFYDDYIHVTPLNNNELVKSACKL